MFGFYLITSSFILKSSSPLVSGSLLFPPVFSLVWLSPPVPSYLRCVIIVCLSFCTLLPRPVLLCSVLFHWCFYSSFVRFSISRLHQKRSFRSTLFLESCIWVPIPVPPCPCHLGQTDGASEVSLCVVEPEHEGFLQRIRTLWWAATWKLTPMFAGSSPSISSATVPLSKTRCPHVPM